jgi:hypothetical protein
MSREGAERRPLSFKPCGGTADRKRMASQLRLHVLVPLAFLGLVGAAFGVYTMGKAPGGGSDAGVPLITTHPDKTKPNPDRVTNEEWASKADAWCVDVANRIKVPTAEPGSLEEFESEFGEIVELLDSSQATLVDLGWPDGEKTTVLRIRGDWAAIVHAFRLGFRRFQERDLDGIKHAFDGVGELSFERDMRKLGAKQCAQDNPTAKVVKHVAIKPAVFLIESQLKRYGKVVVLFYEPGASYDAIQTREARAGALLAHAGFVSVNVSKNGEVGQLAQQYNVLESPTVLIFTRGYTLKARLEGFYDRTAVVQAVKNA